MELLCQLAKSTTANVLVFAGKIAEIESSAFALADMSPYSCLGFGVPAVLFVTPIICSFSVSVKEWILTLAFFPTEIRLLLTLGPYSLLHPYLFRYKSSTRVRSEAQKKLRRLLKWVESNNDFYSEYWLKHTLTPGEILLKDLPIVTKDDLRKGTDSGKILSHGYRNEKNGFWISTSGSTGVPLRIFSLWSEYAISIWYAQRDLFMVSGIWGGWFCRGAWIMWHEGHSNNWWLVFKSMFLIESKGSHVDSLSSFKPDFVYSPLSNALGLASCLRENPSLLKTWTPPRALFTDSELSSKAQRNWISDSIKCPVYDMYASEECFILGAECAFGKHHIPTDSVIVEIVDDEGNVVPSGNVGRVIVTNLHRRSMPLIRYEIGDMAVVGNDECACGNPFPYFTEIHGRMNDRFVLPSGKDISVYQLCAFTEISLELEKHIGRWQVVQVDRYNIEIRVTTRKDKHNSENERQVRARHAGEKLLKAVKNALSDNSLQLRVIVSSELPRHPRGKLRNFVSNVKL